MKVSGISVPFGALSRSSGQVPHVLLTRSPLDLPRCCHLMDLVRLACVRHAASVRPEPGSNSPSRPQVPPPRWWALTSVEEPAIPGPKPRFCRLAPERPALLAVRITVHFILERPRQVPEGLERSPALADSSSLLFSRSIDHATAWRSDRHPPPTSGAVVPASGELRRVPVAVRGGGSIYG